MYFGIFDPTIIILIPAMIFALFAQSKVKSAYSRYSRVRNRRGITGRQAARIILDANGLRHVPIEMTRGTLTDHYDPKKDVMRLSSDVYNGVSIAAVSIAAHESGHAIQDGTSYGFLKFRNAIAPAVSLVSTASWPLLIIGLIIIWQGNAATGNLIFNIGVIFFAAVVVFHTVTLPVEFNASKRAIRQLEELNIIDYNESKGAKKVLSAAAMTYVAALATAVANLVRILLIRGRD
ncbi:MAG TPA: zinc metallopeptidase [Candidatus Copromorpha excrementigallinarum]|uniref:Zinc metallopeptidase n=1 Tax=Candidatus Allocopromorpha excrementigallinarum TaxID=2840742 RepID=A0A9D1I068_9FIRM|nr:zinc metallopeptidase [Candidatus Copromorpha excrementigallinarum]